MNTPIKMSNSRNHNVHWTFRRAPGTGAMILLFLTGCTTLGTISTPSPTLMPVSTPECGQSGTTKTDKVFFPDSGETHEVYLYLPPCYAEYIDSAYPVLYWTAAGGENLLDAADRLIRQRETPSFIVVMINISPTKGYGADTQIVNYVVPYIDSHYRTQPDRLQRSISGISHGAAIAVRAAFQPPGIFGRVAVLSGGIADGEQQKFTDWILAMPSNQRPTVLIDVGDQDGIIVLTHHLTDLLDTLSVSYTFTHASGNHTLEYWDSHMADYLKWLMPVD
jgi:enterochelin esterase-like enzyme